MTNDSTSKKSLALKIGFIIFLLALYGAYYPWLMYNSLPSPEGEFHLNIQSIGEAFSTASTGWEKANSRIGEFSSYFLYGVPLHIFLSIVHPLFMLLLAVATQRLGTGKYPEFKTSSLGLLCYVSLFIATASPVTDWWLDNFNWVYPCGIAMLFFALSEPLFRQQSISTKRFVALLFLGAIAGMGNEVLVLTVFPLFLAPAAWLLIRQKRTFTDAKYWVLDVELAVCFAIFFSSPCWSNRMDACGFSPSLLDRLAMLFDFPRYADITSGAYDCIAALTVVAFLITTKLIKTDSAPETKKRLQLLLLVGLGYLLLSIVIPGYHPHREYRVLQFFFICVFSGMMGLIMARRHGSNIAALLLIPVAAISFTYLSVPIKESYIRSKLWDKLETAIQQKTQINGVVYFSEAEWNALVEDAHTIDGQRWESIKEHDRLVLKTNRQPANDIHCTHIAGINFYNVFGAKEQTEIILSATIRDSLLLKCSPDILLNRGLVQRLGLKGLVIVKEP